MDTTIADIVWYLLIGAALFMIMRKGGCCGGHGHGKNHRQVTADKNESNHS